MPKNSLFAFYKSVLIFSLVFSVTFVVQSTVTLAEETSCQEDPTPPTTTYELLPSSPNGENGWYNTPVDIKLSASDQDTGIGSIFYKIDNLNWQQVVFNSSATNTLLNPSFEQIGPLSQCGVQFWELSVNDPQVSCQQVTNPVMEGLNAVQLDASGGTVHGISNKTNFVPATPYQSLSISSWMQVEGQYARARFSVNAVYIDPTGNQNYVQIATSNVLIPQQTLDENGQLVWLANGYLDKQVVLNNPTVIGIYIDFQLLGPGKLIVDDAQILDSYKPSETTLTVGSDSEAHTVEYFSTNNDNCPEASSCVNNINCINFKIDQTPPSNWRNAGAIRGLIGNPYELYVFAEVDDVTSGLSVFTDKYNIKTEVNPGYGTHQFKLNCQSTWQPDDWDTLITPPFNPGAKTAYLLTPKTSYCNDNWNLCKKTQFYIKDLAGNESKKAFCINGPWIKARGNGIVRANNNIDMLAEGVDDNTDGLIISGGSNIDFFSSSKNWKIFQNLSMEEPDTQKMISNLSVPTQQITTMPLPNTTGAYTYLSDLTLNAQDIPDSLADDQVIVVFVNGTLTINSDIDFNSKGSYLFGVKGNVYISKDVSKIEAGIVTNNDIHTAYDVEEGDATPSLELYGIFTAENFNFQRTLQGTNNTITPSEIFYYEPKFLIHYEDFFLKSSVVYYDIL